MALSDCAKCWDTPCTCGFEYKNYSRDYMVNFITSITSYLPKELRVEIMEESLKKIKEDIL